MNKVDLSKELKYKTSKSSGKGGQHVNKVETRVELFFDVSASAVLSAAQKTLVRERLKNRISNDGVLQLASESERSQRRNKKIVTERFYDLVAEAIVPEHERQIPPTPKSVIVARRAAKQKTAIKKALRKKVNPNDTREIDL
jgi:ribosome-associated protein